MEPRDQRNDEKMTAETTVNVSCCAAGGRLGEMPDWCGSSPVNFDCSSMMDRCMRMCRWFPLVPLVVGIVLLLLGCYFDASITKVLWMSAAGSMVALSTLCLILAQRMKKLCC